MVYEKAVQYSNYTGEQVQPPRLKSEATSALIETGPMRWRDQTKEYSMDVFNNVARNHIIEWIRKTPRKAANGKSELQARSTPPKGLHAKLDLAANLIKGQASARFRDDNSLSKGNVVWNQYLNNNYDNIYREYQESQRLGTPSASMFALTVSSLMNIASSPSDVGSLMSIASSLMRDDEPIEKLVEREDNQEEENYATCTVRFDSILRQDLRQVIVEIFNNKVKAVIPLISEFIIEFQFVVLLTMSLFRNHAFVLENNQARLLAHQGFETKSVFPSNFSMQTNVQYSSSPLPRGSTEFDLQARNLFTNTHMGLLLSEFYSSRGITPASKNKYPVILSLINAVKASVNQRAVYNKNALSRHCYVSALTTYQTNLSNMWADKKMIKIHLDKLLLILLRIHLAPERERKHQKYIKACKDNSKKKQEKKHEQTQAPVQFKEGDDITTLTPSVYRTIIRNENIDSASILKNPKPIINGLRRLPSASIKSLVVSTRAEPDKPVCLPATAGPSSSKEREPVKSVAQPLIAQKISEEAAPPPSPEDYSSVDEELAVEEDSLRDGAKDANRKRIFELKGFLKSLLFQENEVDMQFINNQRSDLSDHEKNVCLLITTSLKPYIPSKVNYSSTGHQLPFVVLANDLLCCAGYAKFSRNICYTISWLERISFGCCITFLYVLFSWVGSGIFCQSNTDKRTSKEETNELQKEVGKSSIRLKDTFKILNDGNLGIKIKVAKKYWKDPLSKPIVEAVPTTADPTTTAVDPDWLNMENCFCGVIDEVRRIVHNVVVRLSSTPLAVTLPAFAGPSTAITGPSTAPPIDTYGFSNEGIALARMGLQDIRNEISRYIGFLKQERYKAFEAVDDLKSHPNKRGSIMKTHDASMTPDPKATSEDFIFSGTDYGIVKMSQSVPVTIEKYIYHLKLYNRFAMLEETPVEPSFQPLPVAKTVSVQEVDFSRRNFHYRPKLTALKTNNPQVAESEERMSNQNLTTAKNEDELWRSYQCLQENKQVNRNFYQSSRMVLWSMKREMYQKKAKTHICS
ncbi:unnamed protein product [Mucor hiemalis]